MPIRVRRSRADDRALFPGRIPLLLEISMNRALSLGLLWSLLALDGWFLIGADSPATAQQQQCWTVTPGSTSCTTCGVWSCSTIACEKSGPLYECPDGSAGSKRLSSATMPGCATASSGYGCTTLNQKSVNCTQNYSCDASAACQRQADGTYVCADPTPIVANGGICGVTPAISKGVYCP